MSTINTKKTAGRPRNPENILAENKKLREEIERLKAKQSQTEKEPIQKIVSRIFAQKDYVEINPTKRIQITSLCFGKLALSVGDPRNRVRKYVFNKFGEKKAINYSELEEILHWQFKFAESGRFYIDDEDVISNYGLVDVYNKNIIDKKTIDGLLDLPIGEMSKLFSDLTPSLQENIADLVANKLFNKEDVDLNKVEAMSRICGTDIKTKGTYWQITEE